MKDIKVITCASYGGTGSSAVTDLLKEFTSVYSLGDFEFTLAHEVDGISDLEHYLVEDNHRLKVDEAIYRFKKLNKNISGGYEKYIENYLELSEKYSDALVDVTWDGCWHRHAERYDYAFKIKRSIKNKILRKINPILSKIRNYEYSYSSGYKKLPMYYVEPLDKDVFYSKTREFFTRVFSNVKGYDNQEFIAMDQLLPPSNLKRYLNYFNNMKVIVVDRDPRDLYILNKEYWKEGWIPTDDVNVFCKWFESLRRHMDVYDEDSENVLRIKFEDFIYEYDSTLQKVMEFLSLNKESHINKKAFLNPDISVKNTKLWLKHPEYAESMKYIESNLKNYCYDYNKHSFTSV
ncbi:sulfotransferase family protein [Hathewaya histolytica]|uniref:sulfotransferase family protein n=1 Tax=Hathewaya histolytica TaxID=1498 RepID=UPI003B67B36A